MLARAPVLHPPLRPADVGVRDPTDDGKVHHSRDHDLRQWCESRLRSNGRRGRCRRLWADLRLDPRVLARGHRDLPSSTRTTMVSGFVAGASNVPGSASNVSSFPSPRLVVASVPSSATDVTSTMLSTAWMVTLPQVTITMSPALSEMIAAPSQAAMPREHRVPVDVVTPRRRSRSYGLALLWASSVPLSFDAHAHTHSAC